ncbi:MAG: hypothetical protein ACYDBB_15625 [Armatimonadota bacterium]
MIKLNLLPSYIHENRRAWIVLVIFVVLLMLQGGVFFKAYMDLQAREKWYTKEGGPGINYFQGRVTLINEAKTKADGIGTKAEAYTKYTTFFTRGEVLKYNYSIADAMAEVANSLGTTKGAWYEKITITPDKKFTADGRIRGLMNFVNYYFKIKKMGGEWKLTPMALPYAKKFDAMNQKIELKVAGSYTTEILKPPTPPETDEPYDQLYHAAGASADASGQAAPAGGAPMPGGPMPGGPMPGGPMPGGPMPGGPGMAPPPGSGPGMAPPPGPPPAPSTGGDEMPSTRRGRRGSEDL